MMLDELDESIACACIVAPPEACFMHEAGLERIRHLLDLDRREGTPHWQGRDAQDSLGALMLGELLRMLGELLRMLGELLRMLFDLLLAGVFD